MIRLSVINSTHNLTILTTEQFCEGKRNYIVKEVKTFLIFFCYKFSSVGLYVCKAKGFCFQQVIFPNNFEIGNGGNVQGHLPMMPMSPLMHPRVKEVRTDSGSLRRGRFNISKTMKNNIIFSEKMSSFY